MYPQTRYIDKFAGPFTGKADRVMKFEDGGIIRFVLPKEGFNSHEYNKRRPAMHWDKEACFSPNGFIARKYTHSLDSHKLHNTMRERGRGVGFAF